MFLLTFIKCKALWVYHQSMKSNDKVHDTLISRSVKIYIVILSGYLSSNESYYLLAVKYVCRSNKYLKHFTVTQLGIMILSIKKHCFSGVHDKPRYHKLIIC